MNLGQRAPLVCLYGFFYFERWLVKLKVSAQVSLCLILFILFFNFVLFVDVVKVRYSLLFLSGRLGGQSCDIRLSLLFVSCHLRIGNWIEGLIGLMNRRPINVRNTMKNMSFKLQ